MHKITNHCLNKRLTRFILPLLQLESDNYVKVPGILRKLSLKTDNQTSCFFFICLMLSYIIIHFYLFCK